MKQTTEEELYIHIKNNIVYYKEYTKICKYIDNMCFLFKKNKIKINQNDFAHYFYTVIHSASFNFISQQKKMENPYSFPSKISIKKCAEMLTTEYFVERKLSENKRT